jgi:fucose 4-O-acetylase-like acetyltransferase
MSIALIVFLHGYNLPQRYLRPWTIVQEKLTPTGFFEFLVANGLLRFLIPMLFAISGYLYAHNDSAPTGPRIRKRFRTLLVPYLAWSALAMAMTYILELFPSTRGMVLSSGIAYIDDNRRLLHNYHWYELLRSWLMSTIAYQMWFIRVLFFYNLAYPALRWCISHKIIKWIFFPVAAMLWISTLGTFFVEGESLLFFSLGIWLSKTGFPIETTARRRSNSLAWGLVFILSASANTWLAFKGYSMLGNKVFPVLTLMHPLIVISGLIACWFGLDNLARSCMQNKPFITLSAFAFFIYAFHTPLVAYAIDPVLSWLSPLPAFRLLAFVFLPLAVIALCIALAALLRRIAPGSYNVLTGARGIA